MIDALLNFIGIARRGGKLVMGFDAVVESMRQRKARIVMVASDISDNTLSDVRRETEKYHTEILMLNRTKDEIHFILGKYTAVMAIEDEGFIKKLRELNSQNK